MKRTLVFTLLVLCHIAFSQAEQCSNETDSYLTNVFSSRVEAMGISYGVGSCYFFREDGGTQLYFLLGMLPEPALSLGEGEGIFENLLSSQAQVTAYPNLTGWRLEAVTGNGSAELAYGTPEYLADFMGWEKEKFEAPNYYRLVYILSVKP